MVRLIMGEKGTGKTKKLIEMINTTCLLYTSDAADEL